MESNIQLLLAEAFIDDALEEFMFPDVSLDVEGTTLEEDLIALIQAENQLHDNNDRYFSGSFSSRPGPFSTLEELLRQNSPEPLVEYESSGFCSPSSTYGNVESFMDENLGRSVHFRRSVDSTPSSSFSFVESHSNDLDDDLLDLEEMDYFLNNSFSWENFQNEMFQSEDVSKRQPITKATDLEGMSRDDNTRLKTRSVVSKTVKPARESVIKEIVVKKDALRGIKKKGNSKMLKIKREQNKLAASRYRMKMKEEECYFVDEYEQLLDRNKELKRMALDKEQEVKVLRKLLMDVIGR